MLIFVLVVGVVYCTPLPSSTNHDPLTTSHGHTSPSISDETSVINTFPSKTSSTSSQDFQNPDKNVRITSEVRRVSFQINRHHPRSGIIPPLVFAKPLSDLGLEPTEVEAPGTTPTTLGFVTDSFPNATVGTNKYFQDGHHPVSRYPHIYGRPSKWALSSSTVDPPSVNLGDYEIHGEDLQTEISSTSVVKEINMAPNRPSVVTQNDRRSSLNKDEYNDKFTLDPPEIIEGRAISFDIIRKIVINNNYSQDSSKSKEIFKHPLDSRKDIVAKPLDNDSEIIQIKQFEIHPVRKSEKVILKERRPPSNEGNFRDRKKTIDVDFKESQQIGSAGENFNYDRTIIDGEGRTLLGTDVQDEDIGEERQNPERDSSANDQSHRISRVYFKDDNLEEELLRTADAARKQQEEIESRIVPPVVMASKTSEDQNEAELHEDFQGGRDLTTGDADENASYHEVEKLEQLKNKDILQIPESVLVKITPEVMIAPTPELKKREEDSEHVILEDDFIDVPKAFDDIAQPLIAADIFEEMVTTEDPSFVTSLPNRTSAVEPVKNHSASKPLGEVTVPSAKKNSSENTKSEPSTHLNSDDTLDAELVKVYPKRDSATATLSPPNEHQDERFADIVSVSVLEPVSVPVGEPVLESASAPIAEQVSKTLSAGCVAAIVFGVLFFFGLVAGGCYWMNNYRDGIRPKLFSDRSSCANSDSGGYIDDQCRVAYVNSQMEGTKVKVKVGSEDLVSLDNDSFLNSLESMTIQNLWTDNIRHTKL